jgi:hypothetical protein
MDGSVKPGFAQCERDRFATDLSGTGATTTISYCYDAAADHRGIVHGSQPDYLNEWIAARAGIGSEPTPCTPFPSNITCATPPNDY